MNEDKNTPASTEQPYAARPSGSTVEQQPIAQNFTMHVVEPIVCRPSKWRPLFKAIGIVQAIALVVYVIFTNETILLAMGNIVGLSAVLMLFMLSPIIVIVALINLVSLPIYLYKHKIKGTGLVLGIVSLAMSIFFIVVGARAAYASIMFNANYAIGTIQSVQQPAEEYTQSTEERDQLLLSYATYSEISEQEAIDLIKTCYIKGFYYTNQTNKTNGMSGELSKTGIVLATHHIDQVPYRISIASWREARLVPIARESQKACHDLNIWHDGEYEPLGAS